MAIKIVCTIFAPLYTLNMQKVVQYIERHKLFSPDDKILVALSGGADSVALLRLLLSWDTHAKPPIATSICAERNPTATSTLYASSAWSTG